MPPARLGLFLQVGAKLKLLGSLGALLLLRTFQLRQTLLQRTHQEIVYHSLVQNGIVAPFPEITFGKWWASDMTHSNFVTLSVHIWGIRLFLQRSKQTLRYHVREWDM